MTRSKVVFVSMDGSKRRTVTVKAPGIIPAIEKAIESHLDLLGYIITGAFEA